MTLQEGPVGTQNFVAGCMVGSADGRFIDNINPATADVATVIPRSQAPDVDHAVAAAKAALPGWAATPLADRCAILDRIADAMESQLQHLADLETMDTGKPITTSRTLDIPRAIRNFRFFAEFGANYEDEAHPMEGGYNRTHRKPVGVVGLITPWNLPLYLLSWKVAPALAMGNTIVAKPSELTPQTATALAQIAFEAGLPAGVLNIVHGYGPEVGPVLCEHSDVDAISFTGGTATGKLVAAAAAPTFKKLSLELGGKNPTIICDDVDLDVAVAGAIRAGFTNGGQVCLCGSRVLVHESIAQEFSKHFIAAVAKMSVGNPLNPETQIGPMSSPVHRAKVEAYLEIARSEGAVVHGGDRPKSVKARGKESGAPAGDDLNAGAYLRPAVITGVAQASRCVQEEIFGPVVTLQSFANDDEAVAMANGVPYGLAASVWAKGSMRANAIADRLDTGMVWINDWLVRDLRVPFGGMKQSGVGREGGRWSLEFYSEARNIYEADALPGSH
jgi:aminomuconate-semialdehyde/2-hydroxymuconate-6-semialdehyde dehydrogenase